MIFSGGPMGALFKGTMAERNTLMDKMMESLLIPIAIVPKSRIHELGIDPEEIEKLTGMVLSIYYEPNTFTA